MAWPTARRDPRGRSGRAGRRCSRRRRARAGRRPSAAAPRGSCRGGRHRWAGCPSSTRVTAAMLRPAERPRWIARSAEVAWLPMPYEVTTPVFEGPFDLLLHLILREQVDLYEVSLSRHRRRLPGRARAAAGPRPRRGHRVPADRRHAGRAEGPPPAARPRRRRPRRGARPVGGARPAAGPPARVQDVQGRGRGARPPGRRRRPRRCPRAGRARRALRRPRARPAGRRHAPSGCAPRSSGPPRPSRCPAVDLDHVAPVRASVADAVAELVDELPRVGPHHVPPADRRARRAARGHRALPRRARAVQAGPGRARPGRALRRPRDRVDCG